MQRPSCGRAYDPWLLSLVAIACSGLGGIAGAQTPPPDLGTSVEACVSCHGPGTFAQVGDVDDPFDVHYVDLDPKGPETQSGYRQIQIAISSVDVTGMQVVLEFSATDENGGPVDNLFDSDGRFTLARLAEGAETGDPTDWQRLVTGERFTTNGGVFQYLGSGSYRYTSVYDPTATPIAAGDTLRLAVQMYASDIPPGNGWCDFDADLTMVNDCTSPVSLTRDIVQTSNCNSCHGVTSDTMLRVHGGRTQVQYCVTCHNPDLGDYDMTNMVHKIHYGANLTNGFPPFDDVQYTRDIDNCLSCHGGSGVDADNWETVPSRRACGSCHDDVDFDTGAGHPSAGAQPTNRFCKNCHPPTGVRTDSLLPVSVVHQGMARAAEGGLYRGGSNGFSIDAVSFDRIAEEVTVDYSVTRDGQKMILQSDPRWKNGAGLRIDVGWSTDDYTNTGSGSTPAQPFRVDALDVGGVVADLGGGNYRTVVDVSSFGFGTLAIALEGHPQADLTDDMVANYVRIPVKDAIAFVSVESRAPAEPRRQVIDIAKCNQCHDHSGAGLSLHGDNRSGNEQVCVLCHNANATDISQRPATTVDGKPEEAIDFKRLIHGIHTGADLAQGLVIYGFGGSVNDFSTVEFIGNTRNCLTCHLPGTYGADNAAETLPSTAITGLDLADPDDDLNISSVAAVCSSCHDDQVSKNHMLLGGASFVALDEDIVAVPEPGTFVSLLAGCGLLHLLSRRRRRAGNRTLGG